MVEKEYTIVLGTIAIYIAWEFDSLYEHSRMMEMAYIVISKITFLWVRVSLREFIEYNSSLYDYNIFKIFADIAQWQCDCLVSSRLLVQVRLSALRMKSSIGVFCLYSSIGRALDF